MPAWAWPIAIPIAFALWLCFLMWAIAHLFGWSSLARHYRAVDRFTGKLRHFRSGKIGWSEADHRRHAASLRTASARIDPQNKA